MKNLKILSIILLSIMTLFSVGALDTTINSNVLSPESVILNFEINETSHVGVYISTESDYSVITGYYIFSENDTIFIYGTENLEGNTEYYYKFNGTTEGIDTQNFEVEGTPFITDNYTLSGIGRVIAAILLSLAGAFVLIQRLMSYFETGFSKEKINDMVLTIFYVLFMIVIITAILTI